MTDTPARDAALLAEGRRLVPLDLDAPVTDGSDDVYLLAEGEVVAHVLTALGPHPIGTPRAPSFLALHGALTGGPKKSICRPVLYFFFGR